jgi:hypothetical protein
MTDEMVDYQTTHIECKHVRSTKNECRNILLAEIWIVSMVLVENTY